jgi:hypothetical protein
MGRFLERTASFAPPFDRHEPVRPMNGAKSISGKTGW